MQKSSLALLGILLTACQDINIFNDLDSVTAPSQTPGSISPSPNPTADFNSIRVSVFGHHPACSNPPRNGEAIIRLGCTAFITATPKKDGQEVPETVHGTLVDWYYNGQIFKGTLQTTNVDISIQGNQFNLDVRGKVPGSFTLEAVVKGVRSGVVGFRVE